MSQKNRIIILASGWSVKEQGIDVNHLSNFGYMIGVNDSGIRAPVDEIISMDRLWMEWRWLQMAQKKTTTFLRQSAWRKNLKALGGHWDDLHLFYNDHESCILSDDQDTLNGFNSGFCALNRALHLSPKEIYIFGFDHCRSPSGEAYWHDPYPWSGGKGGASTNGTYKRWSEKYLIAAGQFDRAEISVFNVSPVSALNNFPKISYQEFLSQCAN